MSWHWLGPGRTPPWVPGGGAPTNASTIPWMAPRSAALSAPVGAPVPARALTMLSSIGWTYRWGMTNSMPLIFAVNPPLARASAAAKAAAEARRAHDGRLLRVGQRHFDDLDAEQRAVRVRVRGGRHAPRELAGRAHRGLSGHVDVDVLSVGRSFDHGVGV